MKYVSMILAGLVSLSATVVHVMANEHAGAGSAIADEVLLDSGDRESSPVPRIDWWIETEE
jgi:hypothetical protein